MAKNGRKFAFGFSAKKDAEGRAEGAVCIRLRVRTVYEQFGLRKKSSSRKP
jgi:hypothetical protein